MANEEKDLNQEANLEEVKPEEETNEAEEESIQKENDARKKQEVEKKIKKEIEKKQEKEERLGIYRIGDYLKEEHKWENWLFISVSVIVLLLGCLILNGALVVKDNMPVVGDHSKVFAWVLIVISSIGLVYAIWPFFKPALPEFKKITWLTIPKFIANSLRVFIFMLIFIALFLMYDYLMIELIALIF